MRLCIYYRRLGEMCSHVAALLFKIEACVRLGIASTTCTCVWNQAFSKKVYCIAKCIAIVNYCHADITSSSEPNTF